MQTGADTAAGVVLAGGRSSRMGTPKSGLEWHGSTLLYRTVSLVARTVGGPVVVVGAPGQLLPALPAGVAVVEDPVEGLGPMQGIAAGLAAVADLAATAFVCSTDMPFLHTAYVQLTSSPATGRCRWSPGTAWYSAPAPAAPLTCADPAEQHRHRPGAVQVSRASAGCSDSETAE
ncbi:MAG: molybdenum cofactor guanylyltransferase, partial [Pseudonocardiales bacterium]|nr:molybdenum cofactor guanylyltransferase [Pseudonocardiales bacterium]